MPTPIYHFTHVRHMADIASRGLACDSVAQAEGLIRVEIGETSIKAQRRRRRVPLSPGGHVSDYVPFYFAPRSPMMFSIEKGNVATYLEGCDELVYLVSSLQRLEAWGITYLVTDRNAALSIAEFRLGGVGPLDHVDWPLMRAGSWKNTSEQPDRKERRMAECLVRDVLPWAAVERVVTRNEAIAERARRALAAAGAAIPVTVARHWYF